MVLVYSQRKEKQVCPSSGDGRISTHADHAYTSHCKVTNLNIHPSRAGQFVRVDILVGPGSRVERRLTQVYLNKYHLTGTCVDIMPHNPVTTTSHLMDGK